MSDVYKPESPELVNETLHEHLELSHYIDVFRSSAERVRRVIFIIMILSVAILFAQWNTTAQSWIPHRYQVLRDVYQTSDPQRHPNIDKGGRHAADQIVLSRTGRRFHTREELKEYLDEYLRRRVEKVFLVEIPGLGVTFDINDLGNFCGLSYLLLLLLLLVSMMREHENLYLAMFKVRRLHDHDTRKLRGESAANYLYHALAMSQVLAAPPTLAQWRPSRLKRGMFHLLFFVPVAVQAYIIWVNYDTVDVVRTYGDTSRIMVIQYFLFGLNTLIAAVTCLYAHACNIRWDHAFHYVNPKLEHVSKQPWGIWVHLPFVREPAHIERNLWAQMIEELEVVASKPKPLAPTSNRVDVRDGTIRYRDVARMARELMLVAKAEGKVKKLVSAAVTSSRLMGNTWDVIATFGTVRSLNVELGPKTEDPPMPEEDAAEC